MTIRADIPLELNLLPLFLFPSAAGDYNQS